MDGALSGGLSIREKGLGWRTYISALRAATLSDMKHNPGKQAAPCL
jgi:hypothetical protein